MPHHEFPPFVELNSKILILGSFPSVKSREQSFFYMHPQNRFYKVLSKIYGDDFVNVGIEDKKKLFSKYHLALYDVIESCDIVGSSDQSIKNVVPADIEMILKNSSIEHIYINGKKAFELFKRYFPHLLSITTNLPSTSSANAAYSLTRLVEEWKVIRE